MNLHITKETYEFFTGNEAYLTKIVHDMVIKDSHTNSYTFAVAEYCNKGMVSITYYTGFNHQDVASVNVPIPGLMKQVVDMFDTAGPQREMIVNGWKFNFSQSEVQAIPLVLESDEDKPKPKIFTFKFPWQD